MIRRGTGYQVFPLQAGGNDAPSSSAGTATTFDLSAMPISVGGGGQMAYYVLALIVTIYGRVTQAGGAGSAITPDELTTALIKSVEIRGAWHGTPLQQQYALGVHLPIIEYLGCGQRFPRREMPTIPGANGTYDFKRTIAIPLCIGNVAKPYQTAQLALMYKKASFVINWNLSLAGLSTGASFSAFQATTGTPTVRCSTVLEPQPNLLLAPGVDWVDYTSPASSNQSQVLLNSFGNVTGLTGTKPNGGVVDLLAISGNGGSSMSLPWGLVAIGSFDPNLVSRVEFPWRSQYSTQHPEALLAMQILSLGGNGKQSWMGTSAAQTAMDSQGYPYANSATTENAAAASPLADLYGLALVTSTEDLQLSDVQTASQNEYYTLALTGGTFAGTNHTLARHVRAWTDGKMQDWANQVIAAGLAASVAGTNNVTSRYRPNSPQMSLSAKEAQFLPIYLFDKGRVSGGTPVIPGV